MSNSDSGMVKKFEHSEFIEDIAEPDEYVFFTVHTSKGDMKGIGFLFDNTEAILEFIKKLRATEVSFWM